MFDMIIISYNNIIFTQNVHILEKSISANFFENDKMESNYSYISLYPSVQSEFRYCASLDV